MLQVDFELRSNYVQGQVPYCSGSKGGRAGWTHSCHMLSAGRAPLAVAVAGLVLRTAEGQIGRAFQSSKKCAFKSHERYADRRFLIGLYAERLGNAYVCNVGYLPSVSRLVILCSTI